MRLQSMLKRVGEVVDRFRRIPRSLLQVDTEQTRRQRELARSENQAGHNLTVQTTIDMARTQTWTGGG